jgi:hypothetical protein
MKPFSLPSHPTSLCSLHRAQTWPSACNRLHILGIPRADTLGAVSWNSYPDPVFNSIQTSVVNGRTLLAIEPLSQSDRAFNSAYPMEPMLASVALAPQTRRTKGLPCNCLQSYKENRSLVSCREPSSELRQQRLSASLGWWHSS